MPTRAETIAKYGVDRLCNDKLMGNPRYPLPGEPPFGAWFECQLFKEKNHTWHIEKGVNGDGVRFTMAWKSKTPASPQTAPEASRKEEN